MSSQGTRPASQPDSNLPPEVLNPKPDDPRRCFICLTDEDPSDPPSSWVNPCPCTLEAHQDCMLSWVTDCERSNKPLLCPVCKSKIELEGPWDPIVALTDGMVRKFTRASPLVLAGSVSLGVQFSLQMYGALALWTFAGRDALVNYILGPDAAAGPMNSMNALPARERLGNALVLTNVAPALLVGKLLPGLGNTFFIPSALFYGTYHAMHDQSFFSWPPSPQLAMAVFPYVRYMYYNFWKEFVFPYEVKLNRQLMGLPPPEPRQANQENNENANGNGEGGVIGFLQGVLDALDPDDDEQAPHDANAQEVRILGGEGEEGGMVLELVIEEIPEGDDEFLEVNDEDGDHEHGEHDMPPLEPIPEVQPEGHLPAPVPEQPVNEPAEQQGDIPVIQPQVQVPVVVEQEQPAEGHNHEVPQAPPARRGLSSILATVSNSIVSALILPGVSFAMGELLRLALPKGWTEKGNSYRLGMMQQQWGRSLIGGCLYVVLKDVVRVYTKQRKVAALDKRRVKNIERKRGHV